MKIGAILQKDDYFYVPFEYNCFERFMGWENKTEVYKQIGFIYELTRGSVYIDKNGDKLGPFNKIGAAIDKFKLKRLFSEKETHLNMN